VPRRPILRHDEARDVLAINDIVYGGNAQRNAILYLMAINVGFRLLGAVVLWSRVDKKARSSKQSVKA
jgi:hypothetical protein